MGLLDRLRQYLGDNAPQRARPGYAPRYDGGAGRRAPASEDDAAIERYRYLLRTAPPDAVERVHAEAFAHLTPAQRRSVFDELSRSSAGPDRPASDDPQVLARSATRSEVRQPGFLERTFGSGVGAGRSGPGFGTIVGGSLLGTVAGVVIGSAVADTLLPGIGDLGADLGQGVQDVGQDVGGAFDGAGFDGSGFDGLGDLGGGGGFGSGDGGGGDF